MSRTVPPSFPSQSYFGSAFVNAATLADTGGDDETLRKDLSQRSDSINESCLVQMYPADVVAGMIRLVADRMIIGRDAAVDLVLADASVSRHHAELLREPDGYRVRDLSSTNGTLVNEERVVERALRTGDNIQIGTFIFKFLSAGSVESKYHESVYTAMTRDVLTGAVNKRYLTEALDREVARTKRQGQPLSLLVLDIDFFKRINDLHGHLIGDEVLREFGARILGLCRDEDLLARIGGEEFCLMLTSTGSEDAALIAERCRLAIGDRAFATSIGPIEVTVSVGIACLCPESTKSPTEILRLADDRLYEAKRAGRNRVAG